MLSDGGKRRKLPFGLLQIVFADVGQPGVDRPRDRLARLAFDDADEGDAGGIAAVTARLVVDRAAQRQVAFARSPHRRAEAGRASVRDPGRVAQ